MEEAMDKIVKSYQQSLDMEMQGILQAAYGSVGPTTRCLHYCKCGRVGEHIPNIYSHRKADAEHACHLPLYMRCDSCATGNRYMWHRFKWRNG